MKSATGAQHLGCISLQEKSRLPFLLLPPTSSSPALLFYICGLLVCKVTTGIMACQGSAGALMTRGLGSPCSSLSGGAGSHGWCWAVLCKSGQSVTVSGRGGSRGDAAFAQSPGCTVRFTQLCCSQCKYGQPHSSPASLPQHTSRAQG